MSLREVLELLKEGRIGLEDARSVIAKKEAAKQAPRSSAYSLEDIDLEQSLRESLATALYMDADDVGIETSFQEMGLDSILSVEWMAVVNRQFGLRIPATRIYDHPTVQRFADFLRAELDTETKGSVQSTPHHNDARVDIPPVAEKTEAQHEPIAIVGMSGRYPGAENLRQFWKNLRDGRDSVRQVPSQRWDADRYFDADRTKAGSIYCKALGALDDIDCFDASFFMIPPAEAETMDPQHRIFLEEAHKGFEDAGYSPQMLAGTRCGVYMGIMNSEYVHLLSPDQAASLNTGNSYSIAAARIAYQLNLKGPALPIDTACSSSLVATHLACQALRQGEIDMALAGGVTLYLTPASYIGMCAAGMLSQDGKCKTFDDDANGFVPGEGVGTVVLKRLSDAERDGDAIHGLILGSGINQDGRTNGITAPSMVSQLALEREVYARFNIRPDSISYVETHGTGTKLGDPIEFDALAAAFREQTTRTNFCGLGSVKSNIGHTSAAAGVAGLHKVLLALRNNALPPTLHFHRINGHCEIEGSPFYVNTELRPWPAAEKDKARRAAVSAFGFSGTNAHLVVEEYRDKRPSSDRSAAPRPVPIVLSARDESRLREMSAGLLSFLEETSSSSCDLESVAYTLQTGRDAMQERLGFQVRSIAELCERLHDFAAAKGPAEGIYRGRVARHRGQLAFQTPDAETSKRIRREAESGDFSLLLKRWVNGLAFDWETIYAEKRPRRVSLPGYPFARERHWVNSDPQPPSAQNSRQPMKRAQEALPAKDTPIVLQPVSTAELHFPEAALERSVRHLRVPAEMVEPLSDPAVAREQNAEAASGGEADREASSTRAHVRREEAGGYAKPLPDQSARSSQSSSELLLEHMRWLSTDPTVAATLHTSVLQSQIDAAFTKPQLTPKALQRAVLQSPVVSLEIGEGVALIRMIEREEKNAFTPGLAAGLQEAFERAEQDPQVRVIVLTGYDNYFATGGTKEALLAIQAGTARFTDSALTSLPLRCSLPVIAAMQGHGVGAGWTLGMFCDSSVLGAESTYHSPYMQYGFTPGAGATLALLRLGTELSQEILVAAREWKGSELRARGIHEPVVTRSNVLPAALSAALHLARSPRWQLAEWKDERAAALRKALPSVSDAELKMHEQTFVGNETVRARIEELYGKTGAEVTSASASPTVGSKVSPTRILDALRLSLAHELHMQPDKLAVDVAFVELGLDSINTITWLRDVNRKLGLHLVAADVYNNPTIEDLAKHVLLLGADVNGDTVTEPPADVQKERPVLDVTSSSARATDIAIIGMAGRFPMASDLDAFWKNLAQARDCVSVVPPERWSVDRFFDPNPDVPGKTYSKWMGVLEDVDKFDPLFFNISPLEAEAMDPQQRVFLEACWHCIENAGYDPTSLSGARCGVFAGCGPGDYGLMAHQGALDGSSLTGGSTSILAARISYFLNLQGPSIAIDTACSSSLVAIASACDSLVLGNSDLALAGGVNVLSSPAMHLMTSKAGMLSPDGRCRTLDERANGFVPGEGVGVVLLKRLADAERDGDRIDAIVRGWGVNQDGKTNGMTAPNGKAQARLESYVYERFGVNPDHVQMAELHGTGTKLGDPIEVAGLVDSFRAFSSREHYCALGSVKSNVGHLLAAAGVAGVIKTVLALKQKRIPATLHFRALNRQILLDASPFYVNTELRPWAVPSGETRRAVVSGFGFSGTNAHLVLEEPKARAVQQDAQTTEGNVLVMLSAKNADRLRQTVQNVLTYLAEEFPSSGYRLRDVAYTLQVGRAQMDERLACVAETKEDLAAALKGHLRGLSAANILTGRAEKDADPLSSAEIREALNVSPQSTGLKVLAQHWVRGRDVDWRLLYGNERFQRLPAPLYPFARERYWITRQEEPKQIQGQELAATAAAQIEMPVLFCRPAWKRQEVSADTAGGEDINRHVVFLCGALAAKADQIRSGLPGSQCVGLDDDLPHPSDRFTEISVKLFEEIKKLLSACARARTFVQVVIERNERDEALSALAALLRTAALEEPAFIPQLLEIETGDDVRRRIVENRARMYDIHVRYTGTAREVLTLTEIADSQDTAESCWKDHGVHVITGGGGALALLFARETLSRAVAPVVVLVGRRPLSEANELQVQALREKGGRVEYKVADVSDAAAVHRLADELHYDFGRVDVLVHAAGHVADRAAMEKSAEEFRQTLAAKVEGSALLVQAFQRLDPKLVIFCSSSAGVTGNAGQIDYAIANSYMDRLASTKSRQASLEDRPTRWLSIDWPYWSEGGMQLDPAALEALHRRTGALPLATADAMQALYRAVRSEEPQVLVLAGDVQRLRETFLAERPQVVAANPTPSRSQTTDVQRRVLAKLRALIGTSIRLDRDRLADDMSFETYGIDSIVVKQINSGLAKVFPEVSPTILFDVHTLRGLADALLMRFPRECEEWVGVDADAQPDPKPSGQIATQPATIAIQETHTAGAQEAIAVIGISGRYSQAPDLDALWQVLRSGRECVTTIPDDRWPLAGFFEPQPAKAVQERKSYGRWGSFLEGFADFDPLFFNISPVQALGMDPQERLFLEVAWEAVESAGYTRETMARQYDGEVGVFVGVTKTGFEKHGPAWKRSGITATPHTSFGSIPNRVSYFLNLHGPSMPIDTMCSSSLTAIHEACQSLRHGECRMAIAGGVNLYLHPDTFVDLSAQRMLSTDGHCKSFGKGGNGIVPGEGVGAVLLKPLSKAVADGDVIHAVLRGSSVNHGGKTQGYTVPNPGSQSRLVMAALKNAGVDARSVTYVEAHGTGTELGDPIEIDGLSRAFRHDTEETGFCAIGSIKSNLGHLEAAAGIAGLSKLILQMRHAELVPSLHAEETNPAIAFERTPFYVQQKTAPWLRPTGGKDGQEVPRIAGLSSFGAGGSNAHLVVQEPPTQPARFPSTQQETPEEIILLSARTEERLTAVARRLHEHLQGLLPEEQPELRNIAYTLQIGREAMEWRLGFTAGSLQALSETLLEIGDGNFRNVHRGQVSLSDDRAAVYSLDEDMQHTLEAWLRKRKLRNLIDVWLRGASPDWRELHSDDGVRRVALPTYPFARETYWVPFVHEDAGSGPSRMHPLLHENVSDLTGLRFASTFGPENIWVADHVIDGHKVLSGAAILEMARAAAASVGLESCPLTLRNVGWASPFDVDQQPRSLHLALYGEPGGELRFEVSSEDGAAVSLHTRGVLAAGVSGARPATQEIDAWRAQGNAVRFAGAACYEAFESLGVHYGPSHRTIRELLVRDNEILARLELPPGSAKESFGLHPAMLDGALQAAVGFSLRTDLAGLGSAGPSIPFAMDELRFHGSCEDKMWALLRMENTTQGGEQKLSFELSDDSGRMLVQASGITFRDAIPKTRRQNLPSDLLLAEPVWRSTPLVNDSGNNVSWDRRHLLVCGSDAFSATSLAEADQGIACEVIPIEGDLAQTFTRAAMKLLEIAQSTSGSKLPQTLIQVVTPLEGEGSLLAGLTGFLQTARLENPTLSVQLLQVDARESGTEVARILAENAAVPASFRVRYLDGARQTHAWQETTLRADNRKDALAWKDGSTYWITGGMGGVAKLFAERFAAERRRVNLVLTGRSALKEEQIAWLERLTDEGLRIAYVRADISRREDVQRAVREIVARHGTIDGILHAAGVKRDHLLENKDSRQVRDVFAPKVQGTMLLDDETRSLHLDFFACFSAGAGILGNPGQADYAAANAFLDEFARVRNARTARGERTGHTFSIDWPLWHAGGMQMGSTARSLMETAMGAEALDTTAGLKLFDDVLASRKTQVLALAGNTPQLRSLLRDAFSGAAPRREEEDGLASKSSDVQTETLAYLRSRIAAALNIPVERLRPENSFSQFGIDSVVAMNLTYALEQDFGSLPKTLLFEHHNLVELCTYFVAKRSQELDRVLQKGSPVSSTHAAGEVEARGSAALNLADSMPLRKAIRAEASRPLDVAIVGLSGRFPQSPTMEVFWRNLVQGRNCVAEVPASRWRWQDSSREEGDGTHASRWGGFLDGVDEFDPRFFNISPKVAPFIDPQERLVLEETWKALEDAGYRPKDLKASSGAANVGVYIASMYSEYQMLGPELTRAGRPAAFAANPASIANRLSYFLDLRGPSMVVDTMCSGSLSCIHLACQDLAMGNIEAAIAGGVNLSIHPNKYTLLSGGRFLSAQGKCESFGEGGDGYIPSEGVGIVLLKRLADAERDQDHIYGVIRGSALNHGGRTNGYSVPNPRAQREVVSRALTQAEIAPERVTYVEAHGTGTRLGDPIEIAGLTEAFSSRPGSERCALGSVKSNIGHCEAAAGIAGLAKILLQLQHRMLVPSIHSSRLNPNIDFAATPFVVNQNVRAWEAADVPGSPSTRVAGLSSFGAGGSNAHLIVEEYPQPLHRSMRSNQLIVLSAPDEARLRELAASIDEFFSDPVRAAETRIEDIAFTLQRGREPLEERLGFVAASVDELRRQLQLFLEKRGAVEGQVRRAVTSVAFEENDDALLEQIGILVQKQQDAALLSLWASHRDFPWNVYSASMAGTPGQEARRISLPTTHFARERYWVEVAPGVSPSAPDREGQARNQQASLARAIPHLMPLTQAAGENRTAPVAQKPSSIHLTSLQAATLAPVAISPSTATSTVEVDLPVANPGSPVSDVAAPVHASVSLLKLENRLRRSLAETLFMGPEEIRSEKQFADLGLDSIVAVEWIQHINRDLALDLSTDVVYAHPTLRLFRDFVASKLHGEAPADAASVPLPATPLPLPVETAPPIVPKKGARAEETSGPSIAIVGMAGRFPGAPDLDSFWEMLKECRTSFSDLPADRGWEGESWSVQRGKIDERGVRRGGFLEEIDRFDPLFFQLSPKEACMMDPGERMFLEEAWHALEDAGIDPGTLAGSDWGVICGNGGDYTLRLRDVLGVSPHVTLSQVPARVSHFLNLHGPSQSVDAGCASALLAVARACDELLLGNCRGALAGGVFVHSTPNLIASACQVDMLSSHDGGRALDGRANGMMPAEAVGVVVLKRLEDALADGDRIRAVIEGWGSNHNGRTSGLAAPDVAAQELLLRGVYRRAKVDPSSISLVEASAAGMPMADTAELEALHRVFASEDGERSPRFLGTVENNVGHAFHAAGMSHLFKAVLSLEQQSIPGTPNIASPHASIGQTASLTVADATIPWTVFPGKTRRAAVSSFGATGVNTHVLLAEAPLAPHRRLDRKHDGGFVLIALSARTSSGLERRGADLLRWLAAEGRDCDLGQLSANLLLRRTHFEERCAFVASNHADLLGQLRGMQDPRETTGLLYGSISEDDRPTPAFTAFASSTVAALRRGSAEEERRQFLLVLADLYTKNVPFDRTALFPEPVVPVLSLPGYPFERRRCWIEKPAEQGAARGQSLEAGPDAVAGIEGELASFVAEITGLQPHEIDPARSLSSYGLDSLRGMRLLNRIHERTTGSFAPSLLQEGSLRAVAVAIERSGQWQQRPLPDRTPAFTERLSLHPEASDDAGAAPGAVRGQLEELLRRGVGVWQEKRVLHFEFLKGQETYESLRNLLPAPYAFLESLAHKERLYPASQMQQFALDASEVYGSAALNIGQAFWIDGPIDLARMRLALAAVVRRHSILRTGARRVSDVWAQVVHEEVETVCEEVFVRNAKDREALLREIQRIQDEGMHLRFKADGMPMYRVFVVHNGGSLAAVCVQMHHFHADGFTLVLLQKELHETYLTLLQGTSPVGPEEDNEYAHFALQQFDPAAQANTSFWKEKLAESGGDVVLCDRPEFLESPTPSTGVFRFESEFLNGASEDPSQPSPTKLLGCAIMILIYRITGRNLPVQMVYSLRDRREFEQAFGDFSSSAPLTLDLTTETTFRQALEAYDAATSALQSRRNYHFAELAERLSASGWSGISIDSNDRDALGDVREIAGRMIDMDVENRPPVAPIVVVLVKTGGRLLIEFLYDRSLYSETTTNLLTTAARQIIEKLHEQSGQRVLDFQPSNELLRRLVVTTGCAPLVR